MRCFSKVNRSNFRSAQKKRRHSGRQRIKMASSSFLTTTSLVLTSLIVTSLTSAASLSERSACGDASPKCEEWAIDGMCRHSETAALMAKTCPYACDDCKREVEEEMAKKEALEAAKEVSRKEVEVAMTEEKIRWLRSFAGLIADAADADSADVEKRACNDFSSQCGEYARDGMCSHQETSSLMSKTCPSSCGDCGKREMLDARASCADSKAKCETWAIHGMCRSDPDMEHFMAKTCPFACDLC